MRRVLGCLSLVAATIPLVGMLAAAQDARPVPVPSLDWIIATKPVPGTLAIEPLRTGPPPQPPYCKPCLFYGGDLNPVSVNANGFANENTLLVADTTLYVPFTVPSGQEWQVSGLFTNNIADAYEGIDPMQATWSISTGMATGNAGTVIASGTAAATFSFTGRSFLGLNEYTVAVRFGQPGVHLNSGTYWLSVVPQCTNTSNNNCYLAQYFLSNTAGSNSYGPAEPIGKSFFNSQYYGYNYSNACTVDITGCGKLSAGVEGRSSSN